MAGDGDNDKPDPMDDLKKGVGLLFRAAKTAVEKLPATKLEQAVVTGVKEVGRAIENVTDQIDREIFGGKGTVARPPAAQEPPTPPAPGEAKEETPEEPKPEARAEEHHDGDKDGAKADEAPKGPRVA